MKIVQHKKSGKPIGIQVNLLIFW